MIAKGNPHNNGPFLACYLAADSKGNERAELAELRGFASKNIFDAFALGQLQAEGTQCRKPFFHVQVRTPEGENLSRAQWQKIADRIERRLGFAGQPRAIVFHEKDGHEHMHLVWSRIDKETMRAIDPGLYKKKLKEVCRALEKEMGLQIVKNDRDPDEKTKPAKRPEFEQSRRLKTDLKAIRESIRDCWDRSDNGRSFAAALEDMGFLLARGDRRDFVIVDQIGGYHALSKSITGATAKETRARLADVDKASLPSIDQAKAIQFERNPQGEEGVPMPEQEALLEEEQRQESIRREEEQRQEAVRKEEEARGQAIADEEARKQKAISEAEQQKEEALKDAALKAEERQRAEFKAQADRQVEQAEQMRQQELQREAYKAELVRLAEEGRREAARRSEAEKEARAREGEIRNAGSRYGQALAQHYDIKDPYGSLARSAMAEYGAFLRDRENLDRLIAQADPETRQVLELRKRIEAAEYMAITSNRIAAQSEIIVGRRDTDEAVHQRQRAAEFLKDARELREQFREIQKERAGGGDERAPAVPSGPAMEPPKPRELSDQGSGQGLKKDPAPSEHEINFADIRDAWQSSDSAKAFAAKARERGYILARDSNGVYDFTVERDGGARIAAVAPNGYAYRLDPDRMGLEPKAFEGRAKELQKGLPSLEEARAVQDKARGQLDPQPRDKASPVREGKLQVPALKVEERPVGKPRGPAQDLGAFVRNMPTEPPKPPLSPAEMRKNPAARRAQYAQLVAEEKRSDALRRMGEDIKAGRNLSADDVRKLNHNDIENIRTKGDGYLRQLALEQERQRSLERERG
jgi:hypothetical protein